MRVGILCSIVRKEEKLIFEVLRKRGISFDKIDDRQIIFPLHEARTSQFPYDVILERCINHSRALHSLNILNSKGIKTVNTYEVARICGDKLLTTNALAAAAVPIPKTFVAFSPESALEAIERLGYPVVLKPAIGSWGRLISKVNDRETAETLLEHKQILGSYHHSIYYIQEYIPKPQRDIRTFVIGDETICGIYRISEHWITNTARGSRVANCPITDELNRLSVAAAKAVGGGAVAIDILESKDGLLVNEVNYTMEFRNSIEVTGVNIPELLVDYVLRVAKE